MLLMQLQVKMLQNSRNNVFRSKQTTNNLPPNIFRCFEVRAKVRLMFSGPNDSLKGKWNVFSSYKQTSKMCFVYLECKLQQD